VEATRATFGHYVVVSADAGGLRFLKNGSYYSVDDPPRLLPHGASPAAESMAPFERADFGDDDRLAWSAGACAIAKRVRPRYFDGRFAAWFTDDRLTLVDATRPLLLHLRAPRLFSRYASLFVQAGRLWLASQEVVSFAVETLAHLFDEPPGPRTIRVREIYPARDPNRSIRVQLLGLRGDAVHARTLDNPRELTFPAHGAIRPGSEATLHDELYTDHFLEVEFPGEPRRALYAAISTESTVAAEVAIEQAVDPAGDLACSPGEPVRQADLGRLFTTLADEPDAATRLVIVDAFEEAGQPYAPHFAKLLAGEDTAKLRADALGVLHSYLTNVELLDGLPRAATLSAKAPPDADIADRVADDLRLGLLHTLRIGDGDFGLYTKLVSSPRAVGLRHVDIPRVSVLAALRAADRRGLRRISGIKFANREMIEGLAEPLFDSVTTIDIETVARAIGGLLTFIARDELRFWSRTPRHAVLTTGSGPDFLAHDVLAAWDRLPLAAITFNGVTLHRDGRAVAGRNAHRGAIEVVRKQFPGLVEEGKA
jgi:hypothetical protein